MSRTTVDLDSIAAKARLTLPDDLTLGEIVYVVNRVITHFSDAWENEEKKKLALYKGRITLDDETKYQLEKQMHEANQLYIIWSETTSGRGSSPNNIPKLISFAKDLLRRAYQQNLVVINMETEYSRPHFEWANGRL